jgi:hypothetical protein
MLASDGAVVVVNDVLDDSEQPDWEYAIARIRARYLGDQPRAGTGIYGHRDVLANSAFCAVDTLTWSWSRQLTVEEVTGLQLSYSFSTPAILGDNAPRSAGTSARPSWTCTPRACSPSHSGSKCSSRPAP